MMFQTCGFIATRTCRSDRLDLGLIHGTPELIHAFARDAVGLIVGNLPENRIVEKASAIAGNLRDEGVLLLMNGYEDAESAQDELARSGVLSASVDPETDVLDPCVLSPIVTIPEKMRIVQNAVRQGLPAPQVIIYVDTWGYGPVCHRNLGQPARAERVGRFRSFAMASGQHSSVIYMTTRPARSLFTERLCDTLNLASVRYLRGSGFRTRGLASESSVEAMAEMDYSDGPRQMAAKQPSRGANELVGR